MASDRRSFATGTPKVQPVGFFTRVTWVVILVCFISVGAFALWKMDLYPSIPHGISKTRTIIRTITAEPHQTLYMNFNQTEVYLSSHSLDHTLIEATLSASAGIEDTVDAWLSRSDLLVRSYQDYVRFDLDVPIDTNQTMAIQKAVRILVPEYKTLFIGNTEKRIRIEQLQGTLHIAQRAGPIEIHGGRAPGHSTIRGASVDRGL